MSGIDTAVQQAVFDRLNQGALLGLVFDQRPQPEISVFPCVIIGEGTATGWDTDDSVGANVVVRIHTWSRQGGMKETKEFQGLIYDALNRAALIGTGWNFISCNFIQSFSMLDQDGLTRHGVSEFRILMERE